MSTINRTQKNTLAKIASTPKGVTIADIDKRTLNALVRRDFVRLLDRRAGDLAKVTAKGKKALN